MKLFVLIVVGLSIIIGFIDLILYEIGGEPWTITSAIRDASHKYPIFVFLLGLLAGHLFACPSCS